MSKILTFDTEATGATNGTKGNPFTTPNRLCAISYVAADNSDVLPVEITSAPYGSSIDRFRSLVDSHDLLVGFNIKYDLHWIKRYGINFRNKKIWDTQLAEFIIQAQSIPNPSLQGVSTSYGMDGKLDVVKRDFWDQDLDTDQVPWDILYEYALQDAHLTHQIYLKQQAHLKSFPQMWKLIWLSCQDILTTQEMEWNGLKYDMGLSRRKGELLHSTVSEMGQSLQELSNCPVELDFNSKDHLSALLYGGTVKKKERITYPFTYKDGRSMDKSRWEIRSYTLPRLVEPLRGTEHKKGGYWETNEKTLNSLRSSRRVKEIIKLILERNKTTKLVGTYYEGIPNIYREYMWEDEIIHGNLNHCRTRTGRLASSKPNQQNMSEEVLECITTRF